MQQELWKIRRVCLELAKQLCPNNKEHFATIEEVIEAAEKFEKYIIGEEKLRTLQKE